MLSLSKYLSLFQADPSIPGVESDFSLDDFSRAVNQVSVTGVVRPGLYK